MKKQPKKNGLEIYTSLVPTKRIIWKGGVKYRFYAKEIRFRIYRQGRIIAASTEGYKRIKEVADNLFSVEEILTYSRIEKAISDFKAKK